MSEIQISDLGPIESLTIPLEPGVVELRGSQGSGKSTALRGVSKMLGGGASDLSHRDGAKRGEIVFGDAILAVTKSRAAVRGELAVASIEGRLDIGELVDPGIDDAEKADARRIKALISLAGVKSDPTIFYPLCGGPDKYAALGIDEKTGDILLLGARVKRALESQARTFEQSADQYTGEARAIEKSIADVDLEAECDERALADAYAKAQSHFDGMQRHNELVDKATADAAEATTLLDAAEDDCENADALRNDARICRDQAVAKLAERNDLRERIAALEAEARQLLDQIESEAA